MAQKKKKKSITDTTMKETQQLILHDILNRLVVSLSLFTEISITDFPYFLTARICSPVCLDSKGKEYFL